MTDAAHYADQKCTSKPNVIDLAARRIVWRRLGSLDEGRLTIADGGERREFGRSGEISPAATIEIRDPRFYRQLVFGGSLGAAEAFLRGYWTCDDLVSLVRIFCRNTIVASGLERGPARILSPLARIAHWLRRNTPSGSRRNIAAHYDLGNEFFALFLDETMAYSCAVFPRPDSTLHEASVAKFDRVCRKLALTADDHVLEIGSGWGGFAVYAAGQYGCRVTTTTISRKQYEYTRQRVEAAGLADRVTVLFEDYRVLQGTFDKLVSIEMIEAVGYQYFDSYFRVCSERLKPHGMMLLQAIVIPDQRYDRYRRSADFIQRYVFPGGCLPSPGAICRSLGRATDLQLFHLEDITAHYAETLSHWRQRFRANLDQVRRQGFSDEFIRTWEFYFSYCEGGFRERMIGDVQMLLTKPACRSGGV
ncbi:MAG TPA: cyclopropane-fatty-acyl-phospholipid synthase family protein [Candidatus Anammoximicrobium sp.]|nr:cyclopropane-fatty-acyl-phospholipid synthase family protein [Candidatus Anammoximicrobium sp.]